RRPSFAVTATRSLFLWRMMVGVALKWAPEAVNQSVGVSVSRLRATIESGAGAAVAPVPSATYIVPSVPNAIPEAPAIFADPVFHDTDFRSSTGTLRSIAHNAFGAAPHSPEVVVYTMTSTQISAEGFVSDGRNGNGGYDLAPLTAYWTT